MEANWREVQIKHMEVCAALTSMGIKCWEANERAVRFGVSTKHGQVRLQLIVTQCAVHLRAFTGCYPQNQDHEHLFHKILHNNQRMFSSCSLDDDGELLVDRLIEYLAGFAPDHFCEVLIHYLKEVEEALFKIKTWMDAGADIADDDLVLMRILKNRTGGRGQA